MLVPVCKSCRSKVGESWRMKKKVGGCAHEKTCWMTDVFENTTTVSNSNLLVQGKIETGKHGF